MEHDKIKRLKSRRYAKSRAVRFSRQKRRSVDIVAGSVSCFEEKTRKLLETADRACGGLHIAMEMIANAAAWLQAFMPLVVRGFSVCLARSSYALAYAQGTMFFIAAFRLPRSAHPPALAAAHLSAPLRLPAS